MNTTPQWVADWREFPSTVPIASLAVADDAVQVDWQDARRSPFHFDWLRDNCPCNRCVYEVTREQVLEIVDVPGDTVPSHVGLGSDGSLSVEWSDGHASRYEPGWLRAHAYDPASRAERVTAAPPIPWHALPTFSCEAVMHDDAALLDWLRAIHASGLTLLTGVPLEAGMVERVARRISFVRESNFGVVFNVESKPAANSNAYTSFNLPPHTDLPTRELQPGLQFLHCLANGAQGGDSIFVDGFAIAQRLRDEWPEDFEVLTTLPVEFRNKDRLSDYRCKAPIISLDVDGRIAEVRLANFLRAPFDAPAGQMQALYRAYRRFLTLAREPSHRVVRRLEAGDMWGFDNRRVLHARTAFDPTTGARHLQGCYVDRDELLSRIRVLERG